MLRHLALVAALKRGRSAMAARFARGTANLRLDRRGPSRFAAGLVMRACVRPVVVDASLARRGY